MTSCYCGGFLHEEAKIASLSLCLSLSLALHAGSLVGVSFSLNAFSVFSLCLLCDRFRAVCDCYFVVFLGDAVFEAWSQGGAAAEHHPRAGAVGCRRAGG